MASHLILASLDVDPAVWRIEIPLLVRERCDRPVQICAWMGLRWLQAAYQRQKGFGIREIARSGCIDPKSVTDALAHLVTQQLIEQVGEEMRRGWKHPRPLYRIPLRRLEEESAAMALQVLAAWGVYDPPPAPAPEQESLFDLVTDSHRSENGAAHRSENGSVDSHRSENGAAHRSENGSVDSHRSENGAAHRSENGSVDSHRSENGAAHRSENGSVGRKEGRKEGERDHARNADFSPPPNEPPLDRHPLDLWNLARPNARPIEASHLTQLATSHGWYWVGRAVLAASIKGDIRGVAVIKRILDRWQVEGYGTDAPAYRNGYTDGRVQPVQPAAAADDGGSDDGDLTPEQLAAIQRQAVERLRRSQATQR